MTALKMTPWPVNVDRVRCYPWLDLCLQGAESGATWLRLEDGSLLSPFLLPKGPAQPCRARSPQVRLPKVTLPAKSHPVPLSRRLPQAGSSEPTPEQAWWLSAAGQVVVSKRKDGPGIVLCLLQNMKQCLDLA